MLISKFKECLSTCNQVTFSLLNEERVPAHFHITELGIISKDYIDCGGTVRHEKVANFQLWTADDFDHRINPQKILDIICIAEKKLGLTDIGIEVEFQADTIGKYGLHFKDEIFYLTPTQTDCLDKDKCGITQETITELTSSSCCEPSSGCC